MKNLGLGSSKVTFLISKSDSNLYQSSSNIHNVKVLNSISVSSFDLIDNDKLIVDQKCQHVLQAVDQYQWDANPNLLKERPKHNMASHMSDALRYGLYTFETSASTF